MLVVLAVHGGASAISREREGGGGWGWDRVPGVRFR